MDDFVPLPAPSANIPWSPNVLNAAQRLSAIFTKAVVVLGQEAEAGRLAIHKELIEHEARPLLEALEVEAATEVIHGIVDGYGRDVMGLHASTNNRAGTVLQVFHGAVEHYGTPSRTRGDYGTENKLVALYMILTRGANRGSFIWGSRLSDNEEQDMRFLGMTTEGVYIDDCTGMTSSEIHDHYGADTDHHERPSSQTGAGNLSDEDFSDVSESELDSGDEDSDLEGIDLPPSARQVFDGLDGLMQRVHVKRYPCPFNQDELGLFIQALATAEEEDLEPRGFGVLPEEWENGRYPAYELLKTGKKGTKELRVDLPDHVWRPRAMKWARALVLMEYMLESSSH
ncbi:hypothetical protein AAF712_016403 [Marasmius tenuissimus]|uniref:Integrase core domain-containing protein n=1 Tax=Marasmius tenuissimus TaxID=585030 RepID=A0ABR2Z6M0_9AGAR